MDNMTWEQLAAHIAVMDDKQKKTDVTIRLLPIDESFGVNDIAFSPEDDVVDKNHPFLVVKTEIRVKDAYMNGLCPDCQEEIPDDVVDGDACENCNHVFYYPRRNDPE